MLWLLFGGVMVLTIVKDQWLTTEAPNMLFYLVVPLLTIFGGVLSMYGVAKLRKYPIPFVTLFAISVGVNTLMQVVENLMKITYYLVWEYPGILYFAFVMLFGFLLMVYGLVRWGNVTRWMAIILTGCDFVGGIVVGILLTEVIGLTTSGS